MTAVYTAQTVSFQLRAEGCALMTVIEETNDAVGHAHLVSSAHHYAKTIGKPITIHNGRDWHILTVEPNGAVTCECCGNPIGYCICAETLPPVSGGSPELDESETFICPDCNGPLVDHHDMLWCDNCRYWTSYATMRTQNERQS